MQWWQAIEAVSTIRTSGRTDIDVRGVQYDSRRVHAGDVFVAMRGGSVDGNQFIHTALRQGAAALLTDSDEIFTKLHASQPELAIGLVDSGRRALAEVSAAVFGHPERALVLTAVTGTNGKTTTTFLLEQLLRSVGRKSVLIGTVETRVGEEIRASEHTTPESRDVLSLFREGVQTGCSEAIMEMSSHALEQERVWGLPVEVAIFTNLTQDHLDYHGTMDAYAQAKARLFAGVGAPPPRVAVINEDVPYASEMVHAFGGERLMRYGLDPAFGTHRALDLQLTLGGTKFNFVTPDGTVAIDSPLSGRVNVYNLLAAMCAALARGMSLEQLAAAATTLKQVPGRFEVVPGSREAGFTVIVDYAHTDDALRNLIRLARESVAAQGGRVITVFGCGGDRDKTKRPKMGRAAGEESDLVVVTSDNPRSERPMDIIHEALRGVRETPTTFLVEEDRRVAIEVALRKARRGDIVLIAGKGHEKQQIFADGAVPFDDVAEAGAVLATLHAEVKA
ncbi:MAG: UDP-N-acetylmuramoyl-L-alanyl-D-glutamate--2,6-diaminopimelate ligase [Janthinobacterium lividum]